MNTMDKYGQTLLIGVSGGPDSMALLDMMVKQFNGQIIVAHMNYHHRNSANRDQHIVESYCKDHSIIFEVEDYTPNGLTNFQADARKARYGFFKRLYDQYQCDCLLLAHHQDDLVETYFMQKESGREVDFYGLTKERVLHGMKVVRPLLKYRKKELAEYCLNHHIPYGIDETNLGNDYRRNQIRHTMVETMDDQTMDTLVKTIDHLNKDKYEIYNQYKTWIKPSGLYCAAINHLPLVYLRWFIREYSDDDSSHKDAYYQQLKDILNQRGWVMLDGGTIEYRDGYITYHPIVPFKPIILYSLEPREYPGFTIATQGTIRQGIHASCDEFPLTVRKVNPGDKMVLSFGSKSLHRYFIDHKVPMHIRKNALVVVNCHGQIIFTSTIGCDLSHYTDTFKSFMVQSFS